MSNKKNCESCDMPFAKDPKMGGSEADGSRSNQYCSYCYENGIFTYQGRDVSAFQAYVIETMVKEGWWRPIAWLVTRRIPNLPRWRS